LSCSQKSAKIQTFAQALVTILDFIMKFEFMTTYFPLKYHDKDVLNTKQVYKAQTINPAPSSLCDNEEYNSFVSEMGNDGWELINVESVQKGVNVYTEHDSNNTRAFGYSLTAGFMFFWKRELK